MIDLSVAGDLDTLIADWLRLAAVVATTSYFQSPDWALTWRNNFGAGRPARVACWYDGNRLVGLVALYQHSERLHSRLPLTLSAQDAPEPGYYRSAGINQLRFPAPQTQRKTRTSGVIGCQVDALPALPKPSAMFTPLSAVASISSASFVASNKMPRRNR